MAQLVEMAHKNSKIPVFIPVSQVPEMEQKGWVKVVTKKKLATK